MTNLQNRDRDCDVQEKAWRCSRRKMQTTYLSSSCSPPRRNLRFVNLTKIYRLQLITHDRECPEVENWRIIVIIGRWIGVVRGCEGRVRSISALINVVIHNSHKVMTDHQHNTAGKAQNLTILCPFFERLLVIYLLSYSSISNCGNIVVFSLECR